MGWVPASVLYIRKAIKFNQISVLTEFIFSFKLKRNAIKFKIYQEKKKTHSLMHLLKNNLKYIYSPFLSIKVINHSRH